jgi:hypothetical protein
VVEIPLHQSKRKFVMAVLRKSQDKLRLASSLILGVSSEIAWIPACAGTTETGVNFQTTISKPLGLTEGGLI